MNRRERRKANAEKKRRRKLWERINQKIKDQAANLCRAYGGNPPGGTITIPDGTGRAATYPAFAERKEKT